MPSFSIPLSGLKSFSTELNTIANNLANLNTTGYKDQSTTFSDLFYQQFGQNGAGDAIQVGAGTQVASTTADFTAGSPTPTGVASNVALTGDGFFVVEDKDGNQFLTRDGSFTVDSSGNLVTANGERVMGFAGNNGVVNASGPLTGLTIPIGGTEQAQASTTFAVGQNLDASATVGATQSSTVTVYDSLGVSHQVEIDYTKTTNNKWGYTIDVDGTTLTAAEGGTGTLNFTTSGAIDTSATTIAPIQFSVSDGAADMDLTWNLTMSGDTITQNSGSSSSSQESQSSNFTDGFAAGKYAGFSVDGSGNIVVSFSNNQKVTVGQIGVASVQNEQGLVRAGNGDYQTTQSSGNATIGIAGTGGRGGIQGAALEGSNVDTSTEFANLIVAQRAFQANSKAVTTFDSITQNVINMVSGQ
jgi:flagellar hook protein FlgE